MALKVVNKMIRSIAVWEAQNRGDPKMIQMLAMINPKRMMKPMKLECLSTETMRKKQSNIESF